MPTEVFDLTDPDQQWKRAQSSSLGSLKWAGIVSLLLGTACLALLAAIRYPPAEWTCFAPACETIWSPLTVLWIPGLSVGAFCLVTWFFWSRPGASTLRIEDAGLTFVLPSGREITSPWAGGTTLRFQIDDASTLLARNPKVRSTIPFRYEAKGPGLGPTPLPDSVYQALETAARSHGFVPESGIDRGIRTIIFRRAK